MVRAWGVFSPDPAPEGCFWVALYFTLLAIDSRFAPKKQKKIKVKNKKNLLKWKISPKAPYCSFLMHLLTDVGPTTSAPQGSPTRQPLTECRIP
jgi:hypothetical protein